MTALLVTLAVAVGFFLGRFLGYAQGLQYAVRLLEEKDSDYVRSQREVARWQ